MCAHTEEYHERFGLCEERFSEMAATGVSKLYEETEAAKRDMRQVAFGGAHPVVPLGGDSYWIVALRAEDKAQLDRIEAKLDDLLKAI